MLKKIFITVGILLVIVLGFGLSGYLWMYTPTSGSKIASYPEPKSALLIVDIQEDITGPASRMLDNSRSEPLITTVNKIIETANLRKMPVVYIGQEMEDNFINRALSGGTVIEGQPGTKQDSRLKIVDSAYFPKRRADAFSNQELEKYLAARQVQKLYVVGVDAVYCVFKTAQGGVNRGYEVTIIPDATLTMTDKSSSEIAEMYKKASITTMSSTEFLKL